MKEAAILTASLIASPFILWAISYTVCGCWHEDRKRPQVGAKYKVVQTCNRDGMKFYELHYRNPFSFAWEYIASFQSVEKAVAAIQREKEIAVMLEEESDIILHEE